MNDPMELVSHVNRSKSGMTKMQIQISIQLRAGLSEASQRLGLSQLSLIRSAISAYLQAHGAEVGGDILPMIPGTGGGSPQGVAPAPTDGAMEPEPEPEPEPVIVPEPEPVVGQGTEPVTEPEPTVLPPVPEPDATEPGPDPGLVVPEQTSAPKRSRGRKGKA